MSAWRRKAVALFGDELQGRVRDEALETPYALMTELRNLLQGYCRRAERSDAEAEQRVREVFAFAEWCSRQPAKALWNAAGVGFYEHLFDEDLWRYRRVIVLWLSPTVQQEVSGLWDLMVPIERRDSVRQLLKGATKAERWHELDGLVRDI